jgi:hypothetical protein
MVINFRDWPIRRAEDYPACLDIVRRLVKPKRDRNKRVRRRERWWIYGEHAPGLYAAIGELDKVIAIARVSNSLAPVLVTTGIVYAEKCVVFATDSFELLAFLNSDIHAVWTLRYTSTLETRLNYAPSDVFLKLPRPQSTRDLEALGQELDENRRQLMLSRSWGLTSTYNRVHNPDSHDPAIQELRDIHVAIDEAVMRAYGWDDLDLKIGHHPTKIGIRWTVSKEARFELLDRLLEENHRRYALENPS